MPDHNPSKVKVLNRLTDQTDTDLHVFLLDTTTGDPGPIIPNRHTFYEFIFLSEAHGEIQTIDFQPYPMHSGSIFFLAPGQIHSWESNSKLKGRVLRFTEACFPRPCLVQNLSILSQETSVFFTPPKELFATSINYLDRIRKEQEQERILNHENANALLMILLIELERAFVAEHGEIPLVHSETISRLIAFHQKEDWKIQTVENAARALGVSEDSLNREVKRYSGLSAGAFLRSRTALEAKRMLIFLNQPASLIGEHLGFVDPAYFSRFFKRETGMSPTEFREKYH